MFDFRPRKNTGNPSKPAVRQEEHIIATHIEKVGRIPHKPGQTLFAIHKETGEIKEAPVEVICTIYKHSYAITRKLVVEANYMYRYHLNRKAVEKKGYVRT